MSIAKQSLSCRFAPTSRFTCHPFHTTSSHTLGFKHNPSTRSILPPSYPHRLAPLCAIKAVETFDGSFELDPDNKAVLFQLLESDTCCQTVSKEAGVPTSTFTGLLFQPVPWSPGTKKGMPQEFEKYHESPDYTIINVPPNYMFQAKIFKPARLCAVYRNSS